MINPKFYKKVQPIQNEAHFVVVSFNISFGNLRVSFFNLTNNSIQNNSGVNNTSVQTNTQQQNSLENSLTNLQDKWTDIIKSLNERMKDLKSIDGLMNEVYMKRQQAIDLI